ncbi:division plane positioning ATPase MipZ [Halothiobacillus neapolitanus]|uniref:CobQ/CobB/MinD/ParA nucleotide binding domain-containing protein n=1 Tax=Halothiobacillus neapolitanus (strain ATCC 23641 / DSM 15147 / CIP 104769 / NCIMB 8539 / c2) TaxID=555778 RepID=D0KZA4_HALNC|nr:division plane positioning ATPase MipZ [Halothiobacillus neapolitanus]ACX95777.1 hypothetical protein Hneap_0935 [Halothiobacillus neapolitanus c2]TDN66085.1 VirC1 protein [Halothiobacillus neapolitanus]
MILFFHGEKGGAGKSTALAWVAENLISRDEKVNIVEADDQRDIANRYATNPLVSIYMSPLQTRDENAADISIGVEKVVEAAFNAFGENGNVTLINLPGGASAFIDPLGDLIGETINEAGIASYVMFLADGQANSVAAYEKSANSGICSKLPNILLLNNYRNKPLSFESDHIIPIPVLQAAILTRLTDDMSIGDLLAEPTTPLITKTMIKKWIRSADDLVGLVKGAE